MPPVLPPERCHALLPPGGLVWLQECSAASPLLHRVIAARDGPPGLTVTGIFVPGLNRLAPLAGNGRRIRTVLAAPDAGEDTEFLPLTYRDMWHRLDRQPPDAALFAVSPPDNDGMCSFGTVCDVLPALWPRIPVRIAQINPAMPRTRGAARIPYRALTAVIEGETPLPEQVPKPSPLADRAAQHLAPLVPDGAVLQIGLGQMPEGVLRGLRGHRNLRIHSGLIGDAVLDLMEAGALATGRPVDVGVAIGSRRLYDAVAQEAFRFRPIPFTHDRLRMAGLGRFVTVNSAQQVDLFGQAHSEAAGGRFVSGVGGAADFAAGAALAAGGLRVIVLQASRGPGKPGRIVPAGAGEGPVTLSRHDLDVVVTEHGAADLRGLTHHQRAERLIAIAAPEDRAGLADSLSALPHGLARKGGHSGETVPARS